MPKLGATYTVEAPQLTPLGEFIRGYGQIHRGYRAIERARSVRLSNEETRRILDINQMLRETSTTANLVGLLFEEGATYDPAKLTPYERGKMAASAMRSLKDAVQLATGGCPPVDNSFDRAKRILEKLGNYATSNTVGTLVLKRLENYLEGGYLGNWSRTRAEIDEFANFAGVPKKTVDEIVARVDKAHKSQRRL